MRDRESPPQPLSKLLASVLAGFGSASPVPLTLMQAWDAVVGEGIARKARPFKLAGKTLYLKAASNVWMTEIQMRAPTIIAALNEKLGGRRVASFRFESGLLPPFRTRTAPVAAAAPPRETAPVVKPIPPEIERALDKLPDGPLRKQIEAALARSLSRSRRG